LSRYGSLELASLHLTAVYEYVEQSLLKTLSLADLLLASQGAFLSAMVPASSRTRFLGSEQKRTSSLTAIRADSSFLVVDVCRSLSAGPGPFVTGRLVKIDKLPLTFVISGSIKIAGKATTNLKLLFAFFAD